MKVLNENSDEKLFTVSLRGHKDTDKHPIERTETGLLILKKKFTYIENGHPYIWGGTRFDPGLRKTDICFLHHPYMVRCTPTRTKDKVHLGEYSVNKKYRETGNYSAILELPSGHVRRIGHDVGKTKPSTLYVSSYYISKGSQEELRSFFNSMRSKPMFFLCDKQTFEFIQALGIELSNVVFGLSEFTDLPILDKFPRPFWNKHARLNPELAMLRANKKECLRLAKHHRPNYTWYIWMDVLCLPKEDPNVSEFGERHTFSPGVYIQALKEIPKDREVFTHEERYVSATIVLAHKDYVDRLSQSYDKMALAYDSVNVSPTSDTSILITLSKKENWIHPVDYESTKPNRKYGSVNMRNFFLQTL